MHHSFTSLSQLTLLLFLLLQLLFNAISVYWVHFASSWGRKRKRGEREKEKSEPVTHSRRWVSFYSLSPFLPLCHSAYASSILTFGMLCLSGPFHHILLAGVEGGENHIQNVPQILLATESDWSGCPDFHLPLSLCLSLFLLPPSLLSFFNHPWSVRFRIGVQFFLFPLSQCLRMFPLRHW